MTSVEDAALAQIVRAEAGLIVASLHRRTGDFDVAEEAVQEAVVAALRTWRTEGVPANPGGWLALTARRRAIDLLRRRTRELRMIDELGESDTAPEPPGLAAADERLPMLFGCCHPALGVEARLALTLRAVVGMTTAQIASAFLVPEATMAQRLVRAKRKIAAAGIPFAIPSKAALAARLDDVMTVVYLTYNAGYLDPSGGELAGDAIWLAELVTRSLPKEAEAWGLLSLLTNLSARSAARFDAFGRLVLLSEQDRNRWDRVGLVRAEGYLARAARLHDRGRFQLQAAIAAVHAEALRWEDTDWLQILTLYDVLLLHDRSPVVRLNHAIALGQVQGPTAALAELEGLEDRLGGYHLFHATRAELLAELGQVTAARTANERALALTSNPAEQELLRNRIASYDG
jgi:RNA polymerase sigma factor (sigma-70 family)